MAMIDGISNTLTPTNTYKEDNIKRLSESNDISKDEKVLMKSCQDFEAIFIHMMLKNARSSSVSEDGLVPKSQGTKIFEDMFDQEIAGNISTSNDGGIGIAKMLYDQMKMSLNHSSINKD